MTDHTLDRGRTTFNLVKGVIVGKVRYEDYGAYREAVAADPCAYCAAAPEVLDHIIPRVTGGGNGWDNLTSSCRLCNTTKRSRSLLGHLLARSLDTEIAQLKVERGRCVELGPPRIPEADRAPKRSSRRIRRNWRPTAREGVRGGS